MPESIDIGQSALEAPNPYVLRVNLGMKVSETDVRTALATGDLGSLH
jgi:hypothetical protein